jgi:hypothetical protein
MQIPKILIVIEHEPADKLEDGTTSPGYVVGVHSNLPARYLDIVVHESEVTGRDENGAVTGWQCETRHPRGEAPFEVPIEPPLYTQAKDDPPRERNDGIEEWSVMFWHGDNVQHALVLKAPDIVTAAQRVMQEFPLCRIVKIDEQWPDEHPMTYLDENKIILPVGGPRVPMREITEQ